MLRTCPLSMSCFPSLLWAGLTGATVGQKGSGVRRNYQAGPGAAAASLSPAGRPVHFLLSADHLMPICLLFPGRTLVPVLLSLIPWDSPCPGSVPCSLLRGGMLIPIPLSPSLAHLMP